jgi:hypothetical protein
MIPVVLIHSGNPDYLQYSIKKALQNNEVHLIGDVDPNIENLNFHYISDYITEDYHKFISCYKHLSTCPYDFELFCFLRWFLLREFMNRNNIEVSFYIDSDVMLYVNVNEEYHKFIQYDFTLLHRTAAVSSFITKVGIENFCNFLIKTYSEQNSYNFEKIESHYIVRQKHGLPGGVCDMTLLDFFHYHSDIGGGPGKIGEMMTIIDGTTYDHNINAEDQYFEFSGIKKVQMIDGFPYVMSKKLNKLIRFNSLHFNSGAKYLMKNYM